MKILILCSDGPHHKYLISEIHKSFDDIKVIIEPEKAKLKLNLQKKKYKQYFQMKYQMLRRDICGSNKFRNNFFQKDISDFNYANYDILFVESINEENVINQILSYEPNICIIMGTTILQEKILKSMDEINIINIHGGYLPDYKGNHCFFFAFYNEEYDKIGSTIHFVNNGIDTGDIIERIIPNFESNDTPESLYCKAEKEAVNRLIKLLKDFQSGKELPRKKQEDIGKLYYTKDRKLYYDIKLFIRQFKNRINTFFKK